MPDKTTEAIRELEKLADQINRNAANLKEAIMKIKVEKDFGLDSWNEAYVQIVKRYRERIVRNLYSDIDEREKKAWDKLLKSI